MSDFDSSLPVRTQTNADVVAAIADVGTPSQTLAITAAGEAKVDLTSAASFGSPSGGTAGTQSELVGGIYNATPPTLTDGQQASLQLDVNGKLITSTSISLGYDTNYGSVGASTLRTASQIGNATGAADFNEGANSAQTLRVSANIARNGNELDYNIGTPGANTVRAAAILSNSSSQIDYNYGAVGANSVRVASQIGNSAGAANFGAGATGAQTLRVEANQGAAGSSAWPVYLASASGASSVNDYKDASAIAAGASDNHDYTVTAGKTLHLNQVESSGSGKAKMLISVETGVATGTFTTRFVQFNSTADANMSVKLSDEILVAAGVRVRVVMSNRDLLAQDLYSTICGYEV